MISLKKLKFLAFTISIVLAPSIANASSLECTDAEIEEYMDKTNIQDRKNKMSVDFKQFEHALREIKVAEIEASPNGDDLFQQDCLAVMGDDFKQIISDYKQDIKDMLNDLNSLASGGFDISALTDSAWEAIKEEFGKAICSSMTSVADFIEEAENDFTAEARRTYSKTVAENNIDILLDKSKMDKFLTDITRKELNDTEGLLRWKDGSIDKEYFKDKLTNTAGKQRDDKVREEIGDLFDGI